jgi:hypothetical protein
MISGGVENCCNAAFAAPAIGPASRVAKEIARNTVSCSVAEESEGVTSAVFGVVQHRGRCEADVEDDEAASSSAATAAAPVRARSAGWALTILSAISDMGSPLARLLPPSPSDLLWGG